MKTTEDNKQQDYVLLSLEKAKKTLREAKGNIEMEFWDSAANRLYYACFHAAEALLNEHGFFPKTHSGLSGLLGLHFIQTGIINEQQGSDYSRILKLREKADYNNRITVTLEEVKQSIIPAENFIVTAERLILEKRQSEQISQTQKNTSKVTIPTSETEIPRTLNFNGVEVPNPKHPENQKKGIRM